MNQYDPEVARSYRKEHRNVPFDQLEETLKNDGIIDQESDHIPHLRKQMQRANSTRSAVARPRVRPGKKKIVSQQVLNDRKAKAVRRVTTEPPGYPALKETMTADSMSISAPTSRTQISRAGKPSVNYRANGDCSITHREFIQDVTGQVATVITPISINPGLVGSFPWLSRIAANYESYQFESLRFHYETSASTAGTGVVVLTVDYDPADQAPTSKTQMLAYRGAVRSSPWSPSCHVSLKEDITKRKTYYVRAGNLAPTLDITLYDTGTLYVMTTGQGSTANIGELWVEYTLKLMTPRALSAGGGNAVWATYDPIDNTNIINYTSGNLPATVVSSGTTTAVATVTFNQPWQGVCTFDLSGTTLVAAVFGGTCTRTDAWSVVNGAATQLVGHVSVNALPGQTLTVTVGNATIVPAANNGFWFTQGLGNYQ